MKTPQGALDLKKWDCAVPGKDKTIWEGGLFKLEVLFPDGMSIFPVACHEICNIANHEYRVPYETAKMSDRILTILYQG